MIWVFVLGVIVLVVYLVATKKKVNNVAEPSEESKTSGPVDPFTGEPLINPVPYTLVRPNGARVTFLVNRLSAKMYCGQHAARILQGRARLLDGSVLMGSNDDTSLLEIYMLYLILSGESHDYAGPGFEPGGGSFGGAGARGDWMPESDVSNPADTTVLEYTTRSAALDALPARDDTDVGMSRETPVEVKVEQVERQVERVEAPIRYEAPERSYEPEPDHSDSTDYSSSDD